MVTNIKGRSIDCGRIFTLFRKYTNFYLLSRQAHLPVGEAEDDCDRYSTLTEEGGFNDVSQQAASDVPDGINDDLYFVSSDEVGSDGELIPSRDKRLRK